ncbi:hypothetical protein [Estrella lausannensis]|uniref:Uncharacterized protein n=1 Tax=Estrella lausannensis TaxID=483423 RepID=A0A0H5DTG8_9BACT|nr:hypothetical protein [Estrella lausannensis]CRX39139.1 hypothetical protein ELAC_1814 [Estrella lausannensis]
MIPLNGANAANQCQYPEIIVIEDESEVVFKQEPVSIEENTEEKQNLRVGEVGRRCLKQKLINVSELEDTLTDKMKRMKDIKRAHSKPLKESGDRGKNTLSFVRQTLKEANRCWENQQFVKAAELYSQVAYHKEARRDLAKASHIQVFRDLYLSHLEIWKGSESVQEKAAAIDQARYSLNQYLKEEVNGVCRQSHFATFAHDVFELAVKLMQDQCEASFEHWDSLLAIYLEHPILVGVEAFKGCIDDVLYNMTACISNLAASHPNVSQELAERMRELLNHQSIPQDLKENYQRWLLIEWNVAIVEKAVQVADGDNMEGMQVILATVVEEKEGAGEQNRVVSSTEDFLVDWMLESGTAGDSPNPVQPMVFNPFMNEGDEPQPLFDGPQPLFEDEEAEVVQAMHILVNLNPVNRSLKRSRESDHDFGDKRRKS